MKRPAVLLLTGVFCLGIYALSFAGTSKAEEAYNLAERAGKVMQPYDFKMDATVLREKGNQEVFGESHEFFVKAAPGEKLQVGDVYTIYRNKGKLRSGWRDLGVLFEGVGVARIESVDGDNILAVVEKQYDGVRVGDGLRLRSTEQDAFEAAQNAKPSERKTGSSKGTIVRLDQGRNLVAVGDVVYMDLGADSGLEPGMLLEARRSTDACKSDGSVAVRGEIRVLSVQKNASAGLVVKSPFGLAVGDSVLLAR